MTRLATVAACALLLAASASHASAPAPGMQDANKSRWDQVDQELASMDDADAKAARVLREIGEPRHAKVLKKVAAEDPLTNDRAGTAPMMKGSAREAAQRALEELARRHPGKNAGWLK